MEDLYIVGTGGFASDVVLVIEDIMAAGAGDGLRLAGLVSEKDEEIGGKILGHEIVMTERELIKSDGEVNVALCIGDSMARERVGRKLGGNSNMRFPNIVHPTVKHFDRLNSCGEGNILLYDVTFSANVEIGSFNILNTSALLGHDVKIGSYNSVGPHASLNGRVVMGDRCTVGSNATLMQGVDVEDEVVISIGSSIYKNCKRGNTYVGNPPRVLYAKGSAAGG